MHVEFMTNWNLFNQKTKLVLGGGSIETLVTALANYGFAANSSNKVDIFYCSIVILAPW